MRTRLSISDELLIAAKRTARERGMTLGELVAAALQRELADNSPRAAPPVPVFRGGTGPRPDIDISSNRDMLRALDEGVELDERR